MIAGVPLEREIGQRIATEAREWLGTPWFHNQSQKGIATDCVGLLAGVGREIGFLSPDFKLENYSRIPRNDFMIQFLDRYLERVESENKSNGEPKIGDILAFRKMGVNTHVGIYIGDGVLIHADNDRGVIESYLRDYAKMVVVVYRVPAETSWPIS